MTYIPFRDMTKAEGARYRSLELLAKYLGLVGLERKDQPGSSPGKRLFIAQVAYDINEVMADPELRRMALALDERIKALTGGDEGFIVEGEARSVD